ncbi:MAG: DUF4129 domain-containing protein [Blastocatellia bacterium]
MIRRPHTLNLLTILIWLFAGTLNVPAQVTAADYDRRLGAVEERLRRLAENEPTAAETIGELRRLRDELPANEVVEIEKVRRTVRNDWLDREMRGIISEAYGDVEQRRSRLLELADRIGRLRAALPGLIGRGDRASRESTHSERERLDAILARPEYLPEEVRESSARRWWYRLREMVIGLLRRLLPASPEIPDTPSGAPADGRLSLTQIMILSVAAILTLYAASRIWHRFRLSPRRNEETADREVLGEVIGSDVGAPDLLQRANRLADEGEYRAAIRFAYISTLLHLANHGQIRLQPTKTNRDYLEEFRPPATLDQTFSQLTAWFEDFWYGVRPATADDFELFASQANELTLDPAIEQPLSTSIR